MRYIPFSSTSHHPVQACVVPMLSMLFSVNRSLALESKQTNNEASPRGFGEKPSESAPRLRIRIQGGARWPEERSRELSRPTASYCTCRTRCRTPLSIVLFPSEISPSTAEHRSGWCHLHPIGRSPPSPNQRVVSEAISLLFGGRPGRGLRSGRW